MTAPRADAAFAWALPPRWWRPPGKHLYRGGGLRAPGSAAAAAAISEAGKTLRSAPAVTTDASGARDGDFVRGCTGVSAVSAAAAATAVLGPPVDVAAAATPVGRC